jgi:predicted RecB family nuclease
MLLTDDSFLHYLRCQRRAFLEIFGDPHDRETPGDYVRKILSDSAANRQAVLATTPHEQPQIAAAKASPEHKLSTLELMHQGADRIYQGMLTIDGPEGHRFQILPDLLLKQPGQSIFGDWMYEVGQIKFSRRPKLEYQLSSTFQTWILGQLQQAWPEQAWLMLRDREPYIVNLADRWEQMEEMREGWLKTLTERVEPEVFISRSRCSMCAWYRFCHGVAEAQRHLSLLPGVTPRRYVFLQEQGIITLEALQATPSETLAQLPGFGLEVANKMVEQARSTLTNRAIRPRQVPPPPRLQAPVELYFDIEAEPDLNLAFLHGVLVVDHLHQSETFIPFLCEAPEDEPRIWSEFIQLTCQTYPDAPVYHFCSYESDTVRRLGHLYNTDPYLIDALVHRFVDIHYWVTQMATMPVESYALKNIARWVGFHWRDESANGAQAVFWYNQWLTTGDRAHLDAILAYNEDDCRATYIVKEWMAEFVWDLPRQSKPVELSA